MSKCAEPTLTTLEELECRMFCSCDDHAGRVGALPRLKGRPRMGSGLYLAPPRGLLKLLVALALLAPCSGRTLNETCAAPEASPAWNRQAPPPHLPDRLRPPSEYEAACAALELAELERDVTCAVLVAVPSAAGAGGLPLLAASPWESCGSDGHCVARGGCWSDASDPCASLVPAGHFETVGGVCVAHKTFGGSCVAEDGCLHLAPRGTWETCDGRCVPRGGCWDFADPCLALGPGQWDTVEGVCVPRVDCGIATDECEHLTPYSALGPGRADTAHFELCNGLCVPRGGCGPSLPTVDATVTVQLPVADSVEVLRQLRVEYGEGAALLSFAQAVELELDVPLEPDKFDNSTAEGRAVRWSFETSLRAVLSDAVLRISIPDGVPPEGAGRRRRLSQTSTRRELPVAATSAMIVSLSSESDLSAEVGSPTLVSDIGTIYGLVVLPDALADDPELSRFWTLPTINPVDLSVTAVAYATDLQMEVEVEDGASVADVVSQLQDLTVMTSVLTAAGVALAPGDLAIGAATVSACARHTLLWSRTVCTGSLGGACSYSCVSTQATPPQLDIRGDL